MPRRSKRLQGIPAPEEQAVATTKRRRTGPPPSPNLPSVVIDHTAFPHIIEAVMLYSSLNVLLSFRQTCRTFQALVDDLCPRSITFEPDGTVAPFARGDVCLDHIRLFDTRIWTNLDAECDDSHLCSCPDWGFDVYHLAPDFPSMRSHLHNIKMVRQDDTPCSTYVVPAETCVTFFDLTSLERLKLAEIPLYYYDGTGDSYDKHVFHFVCSAHQPLRGLQYPWQRELLSDGSRNMVIVLSLADFGHNIEHGPWPCDDNPPDDSLFHHIVDMVGTIIFPIQGDSSTVTFVDVESWNNTWNPQQPKETGGNMRDLVKNIIGQRFFHARVCVEDPDACKSPEAARAYLDDKNRSGLFFATLDEYRDQVGHEQFALEMGKGWRSESGWTGTLH